MTMTVPGEDGGDMETLSFLKPAHVDNNNEYSSTVPVLRPSKKPNGTIPNGNGLQSTIDKYTRNGTSVAVKTNYKNYERSRRLVSEKKYENRESLMTHMLQLEEYQGLYNIFLAVIINITVFKIISELLEHGSVDLGMSNIIDMFGKMSIVLPLLIGMHFCSAVPFYWVFRVWAVHRPSFFSLESTWDLCFSIMLGLFIYGFYYIPFQVNLIDRLPPASASIIVLEQLRLSMKFYAFIRENVPRVLRSCEQVLNHGNCTAHLDKENNLINNNQQSNKVTDGQEEHQVTSISKSHLAATERDLTGKSDNSGCPDYEKFLYFMYAPTLIYRDSYPRTQEIRWKFVLTNAVELIGCIYFYNLTQNMCGYVQIKQFGLPGHAITLSQLVRMVFFQTIPGGLSILLGFFLLLHNTQNIGAELLRFGDRMFYLDWWNSDSFGAYYRKWNLPVHDFLYIYIYKEAKEARLDKIAKPLPAILVFLLSSIFHEYVFIFVLQFFYPVLLLFFGGFGMILAFVPNKGSRSRGNLFIWWSLITGMGLIHSFYCLEYYSRVNGCPPAHSPSLDFILPRTWSCRAIIF